jgi:spore photoproduct lyase
VRFSLMPRDVSRLAAEIIFLTHNDRLHAVNLGRHPRAEELLWTPETQEPKRSQTGGFNFPYRRGFEARACASCSR